MSHLDSRGRPFPKGETAVLRLLRSGNNSKETGVIGTERLKRESSLGWVREIMGTGQAGALWGLWLLHWGNWEGIARFFIRGMIRSEFCFKIFFNIYFWEWETQCEQRRGRERGRHRIWSRLQALSYQHRAWCGAWTHEPRDHDLSWSLELNGLNHPGAPHSEHFRGSSM